MLRALDDPEIIVKDEKLVVHDEEDDGVVNQSEEIQIAIVSSEKRSSISLLPSSERRKSSITELAIISSVTPSIIGGLNCSTISQPVLPTSRHDAIFRSVSDNNCEGYERRDSSNLSSEANVSDRGTTVSDGSVIPNVRVNGRRKRLPSFLHLHLHHQPEHQGWNSANVAGALNNDHNNHHQHTFGSHLSHIHVPTLTFTAPASDGTGRKFSFGIRRHSHTVSQPGVDIEMLLLF